MDVLSFTQFIGESSYGELDVAKEIIRALRKAGHQAYLVGGCVRDTLLNRKPKDYDVATDATPEQALKLFPLADKVGAHFGVVIEKGVEIATFRNDGAYGDGRRPDAVHFVKSPEGDAARRDFTVNAMFMDPFSGHVLDFFGGQEDIKKKVLRAVGDPTKRFGEDHLRMMRAVRFAAKLGFSIDPATLAAMSGNARHITGVSVERTSGELIASLVHDPAKTFEMMNRSELLAHVLPEVAGLGMEKWRITTKVMNRVGSNNSNLALAALFCQVDPKHVEAALKRLKVSNDETKHVLGVLALQTQIGTSTERTSLDVLKKMMRNPYFADALKLYGLRLQAEDYIGKRGYNHLEQLYPGMRQEDLHPEKFVTGNDLINIGHRPGPTFKKILDTIEDMQLRGELRSKDDAMRYIQSHF